MYSLTGRSLRMDVPHLSCRSDLCSKISPLLWAANGVETLSVMVARSFFAKHPYLLSFRLDPPPLPSPPVVPLSVILPSFIFQECSSSAIPLLLVMKKSVTLSGTHGRIHSTWVVSQPPQPQSEKLIPGSVYPN
jgi:hypothetical protein